MIISNIDSRIRRSSKQNQVPARILALREASRKARSLKEKMEFSLKKQQTPGVSK